MERLKVKLIRNKEIGSFKILKFIGDFSEIPKPGNFYMLLDDGERFFLPRPYSVFDFERNNIYFLVKNVGRFSDYLFRLKNGDEIFLMGPYGNNAPLTEKAVYIAGGIGFAPLYFHSKFVKDFYFFIGGRNKNDVQCNKIIQGTKIYVSTDDGSYGFKGDVVSLFLSKLKEINFSNTTLFACGPKPMLKKIKEIEMELKIPIYFFLEERMGCGFGGCKGCAVLSLDGYRLVCKDGPVFLSREVKIE